MSRRERQYKAGALGPAFHDYLEFLEQIEACVYGGRKPPMRTHYAINERYFDAPHPMPSSLVAEMIGVDAYTARVLRSAVKYRVTAATLLEMAQRYEQELIEIRKTVPVHLPHEWAAVCIDGLNDLFSPNAADRSYDACVMVLQNTKPTGGKPYPELGIEGDETFIDCNLCLHRRNGLIVEGRVLTDQRLSYCPAEIHMTSGLLHDETRVAFGIPNSVTVTDDGKLLMQMLTAAARIWMDSFHLQSVLRRRRPGTSGTPGKGFRRKRLRKKYEHPQFEHFVVELPIDAPDPGQTGISKDQPRKRLHQVRGFIRRYRSGKTAWVRPHWRGDRDLGVVKKDYEQTLEVTNE